VAGGQQAELTRQVLVFDENVKGQPTGEKAQQVLAVEGAAADLPTHLSDLIDKRAMAAYMLRAIGGVDPALAHQALLVAKMIRRVVGQAVEQGLGGKRRRITVDQHRRRRVHEIDQPAMLMVDAIDARHEMFAPLQQGHGLIYRFFVRGPPPQCIALHRCAAGKRPRTPAAWIAHRRARGADGPKRVKVGKWVDPHHTPMSALAAGRLKD
jgi:hypothetical protein